MGTLDQSSTLNQNVIRELTTITDFLRWGYSYLNLHEAYAGHGYANVFDECLTLVMFALSLPQDLPIELYASKLTTKEKLKILTLLEQRAIQKIPTAYLINQAWFCDLLFYVDERVIIPRSPIAELIKKEFQGLLKQSPKRILDMCTGSGCIAIACAKAFPKAEVDAVDISIEALQVAEINVESHMVEEQVILIRSDLFTDVPDCKYDLIIANPPYVDQEDFTTMPTEYVHEPEAALYSGLDGLNITRKILATAADYLTENGVLICEVGNSMIQLASKYNQVEFKWLTFENGGIGVFSLTKRQLQKYQELFSPTE